MSHWSKVPLGKISSATSNNLIVNGSMQKSGAGLGTLANMQKPNWEPIGRDRWSSIHDKEYSYSKPMSTMAYAKKLQGEEELRAQTKHLQVPMSLIGTKLPKKTPWRVIYNDL